VSQGGSAHPVVRHVCSNLCKNEIKTIAIIISAAKIISFQIYLNKSNRAVTSTDGQFMSEKFTNKATQCDALIWKTPHVTLLCRKISERKMILKARRKNQNDEMNKIMYDFAKSRMTYSTALFASKSEHGDRGPLGTTQQSQPVSLQ
jgi:hypothetical protein